MRTIPFNEVSLSSDYFLKGGIARHHVTITLHLDKVNFSSANLAGYRIEIDFSSVHCCFSYSKYEITIMEVLRRNIERILTSLLIVIQWQSV